jgi:hypothetical protein
VTVAADARVAVPLHSSREAAGYLGVPATTFASWAKGYRRGFAHRPPVEGAPLVTGLPPEVVGGPTRRFVEGDRALVDDVETIADRYGRDAQDVPDTQGIADATAAGRILVGVRHEHPARARHGGAVRRSPACRSSAHRRARPLGAAHRPPRSGTASAALR